MTTGTHRRNSLTPLYKVCAVFVLAFFCNNSFAQIQAGAPLTLTGDPTKDSVAKQFDKSNTDEWSSDQTIKVRHTLLNSEKVYHPDTSIHIFHRKAYSQPWYQDIGNFGSAARNLAFTPEDRLGPTLGYNALDMYRIKPDSFRFYNVTAPYSEFVFNLGSKLEQNVSIRHTQNIKPNWNVAGEYRRLASEGFFLLQRTVHDMGSLTTNYESLNRRYKLKAGISYNRSQQDENGGIADDDFLTDPDYSMRNTIPINFSNAEAATSSATPRSLVTNTIRDYNIVLQHGYSWGRTDTLYNDDSTKMNIKFTPRFGISHHSKLSNQQLTYKDLRPDSLRYADFFARSFQSSDSIFTRQKLNTFDNAFYLNGFIGKNEKQLVFRAGAGIQIDKFSTRYVANADFDTYVSNYVAGQIRKEAQDTGQWFYGADAKFYVTGIAAGNSLLKAFAGKEIGNGIATLEAGIQQNINNAPYSYTLYKNQFDTISNSFTKESITSLYANVQSIKYNFNVGLRNYLVGNYIYMNASRLPDQYATAFNILQLSAQKALTWRGFVLDNELMYQQVPGSAPINIPAFMGRHQISYEGLIFKRALKIATGVQVRYHSPYKPAGYSAIFHRFFYQDSYQVTNDPVYSVFFNFKIKRFRCFVMADQLQRLFTTKNYITAEGYPAQDMMIRFGFNWVLIK